MPARKAICFRRAWWIRSCGGLRGSTGHSVTSASIPACVSSLRSRRTYSIVEESRLERRIGDIAFPIGLAGTDADGLEAEAMQQGRTVLAKGPPMIGSRVAFVRRQVVLRKYFIPLPQARIAMDLGDDRCRSDRTATRIAVDQRNCSIGRSSFRASISR